MGRIVHFEIHAENPERAIKFYGDLFGWQFKRWEGPMPYWVIKTGEEGEPGINGGLLPRRGAIDGQAVIAYVCTAQVASLDQSLAKAKSAGGTEALPKMAIPGVGWLAYCKDTEGNIFGMMQPDPKAA
jgi:predicted enzyme related to lactoylglutathione lyase